MLSSRHARAAVLHVLPGLRRRKRECIMSYVRRCVVPGTFMRAVRTAFAYVVGRQSVTAAELMHVVAGAYREPLALSSAAVFAVVWRALLAAGGYASYHEFLGLCLKEGRYL